MKILSALVCAVMLLLAPSVGRSAQPQPVQGASLVKTATPAGNYFLLLIVTNTPPPNGTNYIVQIATLLSYQAVALLNSNNTFTGSNFFSQLNFPLSPYIAYTPSNNIFTGSNTFTTVYFDTLFVGQLDFWDGDWVGPTNAIDFTTNRVSFSASTSCSITGMVNSSTGFVPWETVVISNAAPTNITFTLGPGIRIPVGDSNPYTVTNGDVLYCSLENFRRGSNSVTRVFH